MKHQNIKKTGGRVGIQLHTCRLGGAMVRVLVIRPKVWWFKPSRSDGFLRATKIRSTPPFGGGVKPGPPCSMILRHVKKEFASVNKNASQGQIQHSHCTSFLLATR
jgi:hypothetical protein